MTAVSKPVPKSEAVGIPGMGYVGLPLALLFAAKGLKVIGFDNNRERVEALTRSRSPIRCITSALIREALGNRQAP